MIPGRSSKNKKNLFLISSIFLATGIFVFFYSPVIFQEGNPWPQIKGIAQLTLGGSDMAKLSDSDNKYLTKSKEGGDSVDSFLKNKGYEFVEQMGSGYFYKSPDRDIIMTRRQYSRFYVIWTITENSKNSKPANDLWTATTTDEGVTFQYPKELLAKYISAAEWPPVVTIKTGVYSCKTTPPEISSISAITSERLVDHRTYCVAVKHEGAAGSVYSSYTYVTARDGKLIDVGLALRYSNCGNYDEEQNKACTGEREAFDLDATVDRIVQTITWGSVQAESLSAQIKKCIVMSDMVSKEKCDELLKQITDYDTCVKAGFSIMKSNPPQCATPAGQIFVENR